MGWNSPGAMAGNAIQEFLAQREMAERQRMIDELTQQRQAEDMDLRQRQMAVQEGQEARIGERQAAMDAQADEGRQQAQRQQQNQMGVRGMMADAMTQGPLTPDSAKTIGIMGFREDMEPPDEVQQMLKPQPPDPQIARQEALEDFDARAQITANHRAPTQAASGGDDALVKVDTMENGKRVTKYLPKSQVAGQTFEATSGGPTLATGQARKVLNFYSRMKEASETIEGIEPQIAQQSTASKYQGQYAPNILQTGLQQSYRQAQRSFTEARLRKESGAAIPTHEYENDALTYFAQPGDAPATIDQKKAKRAALMESTAFESGPAYEEYYGEPFKRAGGAGAKTITQQQLATIAQKKGVSVDEAARQAQAQGYRVQ